MLRTNCARHSPPRAATRSGAAVGAHRRGVSRGHRGCSPGTRAAVATGPLAAAVGPGESGQLKLQLRRHNLAALVENVLSQFHVAAVDKGVRLESDMPATDCFALVDRTEFERMLSQLVSNACAARRGGVVRLALSYGPDFRRYPFVVSDTGGIAPEHQAMFSTGSTSP